ncbi:hypothetical protein HDIA_2009 [Hartmannibacter diazotrophicus]|uniref:Uncharacterized protein n=1 Tax=Hartmannibacter diazotrophicus TaxID=1482074 RepID=A0A2C9D5T5_9HYPH|nr:hypothetical protein [Hartmannibacter diazotrophicus]SON55550.1 hypothetical protein HDIA_2009 [Hartmannibacter diazotrophicus]
MSDGPQKMQKPQWKYEVNLNSILQVITLLGFVAVWGGTWNSMHEGQAQNRLLIERLENRMTTVEQYQRAIASVEFRVGALEKGAQSIIESQRDIVKTQQDFERSISALASDVRVTREIVQRLEKSLKND